MRTLPLIVLVFSFIGAGTSLFGQDRCATTEVQKLQKRPKEADVIFEQWLKSRSKVSAQGTKKSKRTQATYQIPVVVHIIHNGENHVTNIPDEQVLSQIRVINEDFNRENLDASQTPAEFQGVAGELDVEFILAKRTPEGLPTTGINRVFTEQTSWQISDNYILKKLSYWPAEDYLNIWVCNLEGYLGYAQFPQSTLPGLENSSSNRLTDGVVIVYDAFGSIDDGDFALDSRYNKGRTATHEIGHFFGLRHISGDDEGDCGQPGDHVDDTPDQASQTFNCPSHPRTSCSVTSMFQNYLDYTNDQCMNLFTDGQVSRMEVVLDNCPRRASLSLSAGATIPEPVANDLGIKSIIDPGTGECAHEITPTLELKNYGINAVTSAQVRLKKDGTVLETIILNLSLDPLESQLIAFAPLSIDVGHSDFTFEILLTNGGADGNPLNNLIGRSVYVPEVISTPFSEGFNTFPEQWINENPDGLLSWEIADVKIGTAPNNSLMMDFWDYVDSEGEVDLVITPLVDLSDMPLALLLFDVAYAKYRTSSDGLKVVLLTECNNTISEGVVLYDKSGNSLATTEDADNEFVPTSSSEWRTEGIDLTPYLNQRIQFAFIGVNDYGNNLYLDNIRVLTDPFVNLSLTKVITPSPVECAASVTPKLLVRNSGTPVSFFDVTYSLNGSSHVERIEMDLGPGVETEITLPNIAIQAGDNELSFTLENPDGLIDADPTDNTIGLLTTFSQVSMPVPFRENFDSGFENAWVITSPSQGFNWEVYSSPEGPSVYHNGFTDPTTGNEAWLVSPLLDLSTVQQASVYFDISYALRNTISDELEIRASTGCGLPFDLTLASYSGEDLAEISRIIPWVPDDEDDWTSKRLSLQSLVGQADVRLAFVVINNKGNNLYLDNIELFLSDDNTHVEVDDIFNVYPNPLNQSGNPMIAFNFPELQTAEILVTDNLGRFVYHSSFENTLNQVYELPLDNAANGIYQIRVTSSGKVYTSKLAITR